MSHADSSKTLNILATALLIGYYLFKIPQLLYIVLLLLVLNTFHNPLATLIARGWLKFSEIIGAFNSRIILTVVYYGVLVPIATLYRVFNKDKVDYFRGNKLPSYFRDTVKSYDQGMFEKPW